MSDDKLTLEKLIQGEFEVYKKLDFEEWSKREKIAFTPYLHFSFKAWNFCQAQAQAQEKREIEGIRKQLLSQCKISNELLDEKDYLNKKIDELKNKIEELVISKRELKSQVSGYRKCIEELEDISMKSRI